MKKVLGVCFGLLLLAVFFFSYVIWDYGRVKDWRIESEAPDWLPKGSSNVTFLETGSQRIAEFKVDAEIFVEWCEQSGRPLTSLSGNKAVVVQRPNFELATRGKIEMFTMPDKALSEQDFASYQAWHEVNLEEGDLYYSERRSNSGGYVVGFDRSEEMAYYSYSHR